MKDHESEKYWNAASRAFLHDEPQVLWRTHSDSVNSSMLEHWLDGRHFSTVLKTDLFDEAVSQGLYPLLSRYAGSIHGIDIAVESVNGAATRYPELKSRCADVRDLPFADGFFDLIVSNSTLDHFQSTDDIDFGLRELFRALKPGGELVISLDNLQNPMVWLRNILPAGLLKALHVLPYEVGKTYARQGLVSALEKAGFRVLDTRPIMHCPRLLAVAVAGVLHQRASPGIQEKFLGFLTKFEYLEKLPTRFFSGHFVAARALKPAAGSMGDLNQSCE